MVGNYDKVIKNYLIKHLQKNNQTFTNIKIYKHKKEILFRISK